MKLEESCISLLNDPNAVNKAWELGLNKDLFQSPVNQAVVEFTFQYWLESGREMAPTHEVLKQEFPALDLVEPDQSLGWLISSLKDRYKFSAVSESLEKVAELADNGENDAALATMQTASWEIIQRTTTRKSVSNLSDEENIADRRARYEERALYDNVVKGAPIGLREVDLHTFGILPGELATLAGYSGRGKTWALIMAAVESLRAGHKPYLSSMEVSRKDIEDRIDCYAGNIPYMDFVKGKLTRDQIKSFHSGQEEIRDLGGLIIDHPPHTERNVLSLTTKARQTGSNFLIVDQLSFVQSRGRYTNPAEKTTEIINDMKVDISQEEDPLQCLMAVQLNRASMEAKRVGTHHIGLSISIEQVSDHIYILTQTEEHRMNEAMVLDLAKFRRGPAARWMLGWHLVGGTNISVDAEESLED